MPLFKQSFSNQISNAFCFQKLLALPVSLNVTIETVSTISVDVMATMIAEIIQMNETVNQVIGMK